MADHPIASAAFAARQGESVIQSAARLNLCIVQPAGYVHSLGLLDAALYFKYQFQRLGATVEVSKNRLVKGTVNLIFGAHLGFEQALTREYSCVIVNLEQLGCGGARLSPAYLELLRQVSVIDYDSAHAAAYGAQSGDVPVVSFGYAPYLTRGACGADELARRPIDLLFFGSVNERRQAWLRRIEATGRQVSVLRAPVYGPERDSIITQAKAVLNIHHYDSARFEQVRAFQVLSLGTPLISERAFNSRPPEAFDVCSMWFDDAGLDQFFREEFLSPLYFQVGAKALQVFRDADPLEDYAKALDFALAVHQVRSAGVAASARVVRRLSLDLTPDRGYRQGWLNVSASAESHPDLVLDLTQPQQWPLEAESHFAGKVVLAPGEVEEIQLGTVSSNVTGLNPLMDHCLCLLKTGGKLTARVRLGGSESEGIEGARAMSLAQSLWHPYTEGFAASGWFEHRFEIVGVVPVDSRAEACAPGAATAVSVQLIKAEAGLAERTQARALRSDFGVGYAMLDRAEVGDLEAADAIAECQVLDVAEISAPAQNPPVCSIVVPVFNKVEFTRQCVEKLAESTPANLYELIVIDNASSDGTAAYLQGLGDTVRVISNSENQGFVGACNQGAAVARGRHLVFLNNDTAPMPGWLEALVTMLDGDASIGAAGARLVYPDGRLQEAGGLIFSDGSGWNFGRFGNPVDPAFNQPCEVDYCSGAALMVRRELFERLGGFDTRYAPAYYEDTDLCFGVRSLGYKVMYCPNSTVIHFEGITAGTDLAGGFKRFQQINKAKFVEKWAVALARQEAPPHVSGSQPTTADRRRLAPAAALATPVTSGRLHVLIIDPFLPMYDRASGSLRLFRIIQMFRAMNWDVTFIARNGNGQQVYQRALEALGVKVYPTDPEKMARLGYSSSAAPVDLPRLLREHPCQLAWLSFYDIAEQYLPEIRQHSRGTFIVADTVDVHFLRETRQAELAADTPAVARAAQTRARELAIYAQADTVVTVTDADARALRDAGLTVRTLTLPNIHPQEERTPGWEGRDGLVFVGNFSHTPNVDAVLWLAREIMPRVRERLPGLRLEIVGNNPPAEVRALVDAWTAVRGWVPETAPYLDAARISVAPLRVGAGMKGKVGEALVRGLPVVTTPIGAEGMGLTDGREVLIADTPDGLASAIVRLCEDRALWERMAHAGRQIVEERYGIAAVAKILQGLLRSTGCVDGQASSAAPAAADEADAGSPPVSAPASTILLSRAELATSEGDGEWLVLAPGHDDAVTASFAAAIAAGLCELGRTARPVLVGAHLDASLAALLRRNPAGIVSVGTLPLRLAKNGQPLHRLVSCPVYGYFLDSPIYDLAKVFAARQFIADAWSEERLVPVIAEKSYFELMRSGSDALLPPQSRYMPFAAFPAQADLPDRLQCQRRILVVGTLGQELYHWSVRPDLLQTLRDSNAPGVGHNELIRLAERLSAPDARGNVVADVLATLRLSGAAMDDHATQQLAGAADSFIKRYRRVAAIESLRGLEVDFIGHGWQEHFGSQAGFRFIGRVNHAQIAPLLRLYRGLLNFDPNWEWGMHDRAYTAISLGVPVLTHANGTIDEERLPSELVLPFAPNAPALAELGHRVLQRGPEPLKGVCVSRIGWTHRVRSLLNLAPVVPAQPAGVMA
jgi:O-antigen biosynthesis protein